jgi:hypothetical protein
MGWQGIEASPINEPCSTCKDDCSAAIHFLDQPSSVSITGASTLHFAKLPKMPSRLPLAQTASDFSHYHELMSITHDRKLLDTAYVLDTLRRRSRVRQTFSCDDIALSDLGTSTTAAAASYFVSVAADAKQH